MPEGDVALRAVFILPGTVMPVEEFVERLIDVAKNYKTLYVMGCFGAPMNASNKVRYINHHSYNADPERIAMINAATDDTFGFDCVNLLKGVLWGWNGDVSHIYGGASYNINGVPDVSADGMFAKCTDPSTDFSDVKFGEALWMSGHIGLYIGDGLAVECTPKWDNRVQITACCQTIEGYNRRNWSKHGFLPYVDYAVDSEIDLASVTTCTVDFISTVLFDGISPKTVVYGSTVEAPVAKAGGMVLVGWYVDEEMTERYDFSSPVTSDIKLYAKWRGTNDPLEPDEPPYEPGDVNMDRKTNGRDVIMLMRHLIGETSASFSEPQADVNADGRVNAKDVIVLMRSLVGAGSPEESPAEPPESGDTAESQTTPDTDGTIETETDAVEIPARP
jgi:hypothetical protein